jgi:hypothetical protein
MKRPPVSHREEQTTRGDVQLGGAGWETYHTLVIPLRHHAPTPSTLPTLRERVWPCPWDSPFFIEVGDDEASLL